MSPIILVGAGILLLGLGLGLGYWFAHSQRNREATKASDVQNELDEYRRHVTEHFSETAQHFQALGQQYRSLYKHMAHGAEALCDPAQSDAMLEFPAADVAAITAGAEEKTGEAPETIKDYAPAEEGKPVPAEQEVEAAETPETLAELAAAEQSPDKPAAEDTLADQVSAATSIETERTVH